VAVGASGRASGQVGVARCRRWLARLRQLGVVGTGERGRELVRGRAALRAGAVQVQPGTRRGRHGESWTRSSLLGVHAVGGCRGRHGQRRRGLNAPGARIAGPDHSELGHTARSGPCPDKTLCYYSIIFPITSNAPS
jgi:hypothetical protein